MLQLMMKVVVLTATLIVSVNSNIFPYEEWASRSSPYLLDQNIELADSFTRGIDDFPFCEIPDDLPVKEEDDDDEERVSFQLKRCNYRGSLAPDFIYKWTTAKACYDFTPPALFNQNEPKPRMSYCRYNRTEQNIVYLVSCFIILYREYMRCFPVDDRIPQVHAEIERTLASEMAVRKWMDCSNMAVDCCENTMTDEALRPNNETCPAVWDGWSCWNRGYPGENSTQKCVDFAYSNEGPRCHHMSQKMCYLNETANIAMWNQQTDYSTCSVTPRLIQRNMVHVILLSTSAIFCLPAIVIMLAYKKLRTERLAMHRNLLIFIVLRNVMLIIIKSVVIYNELTESKEATIMDKNGFWCRFLTTLEKFASSATFTCMLVDGVFLHRRIVAVFKKALNPKIVYPVAAAITCIPVITWIVLMSVYNDTHCWIVYYMSGIQWVLDAPRITILLINTILLVDILRVIMTKLNRENNTYQLSTAKTTLFLMPLFGVQFLLTAWRPDTNSCPWEQTYYIFTYVMEALQGILVSILYCYYNKEVHNLIMATYKKTETIVSTHFTRSAGRRKTGQHYTNRRDTCSTMVPEGSQRQIEDLNENDSMETGSRVHFAEPIEIAIEESNASFTNEGLVDSDFEAGCSNLNEDSKNDQVDAMNETAFGHFKQIDDNFNKASANS